MYFVADQAKTYNADPVLTFEQLLFQKAYETHWNESESSRLKQIVCRLYGVYKCMIFLGLHKTLKTISEIHLVPHMLSCLGLPDITWRLSTYLIIEQVI